MKIKKEKIKAFDLRKKGKSYGQISKILNINKSTISGWLKDIDWSQDIKKQLIEKSKETSRKRLIHLNNLKKEKWNKHYAKAKEDAIREFRKIKNNKLFITGITIYWGEGDKSFSNGKVRVINTDYKMLYVFNKFLRRFCDNSNKVNAAILLYPDLNTSECLEFWSKSIKIPKESFFKPTVIQGKHKTKKLGHGICSINVSDKYLKKKILTWIDLLTKEFYTAGIV